MNNKCDLGMQNILILQNFIENCIASANFVRRVTFFRSTEKMLGIFTLIDISCSRLFPRDRFH